MLAIKRLQQITAQLRQLQTLPAAKFSKMAQLSPNKIASTGEGGSKCGHIFTKHLPEGVDPRQIVKEFMSIVNMQPNEIEAFLATDESRRAAEGAEDAEEQEGRHLARRVCELIEKVGERKDDPHAYELSLLYEADLQQMYQVTDYIKCHLEVKKEKEAQGQEIDPLWRFRLMNCGYDPLKEDTLKAAAELKED